MSYLKIIILIFFITSAQSEGIKWKGKGSKETDNYIQLFNKGFKETYIDGNLTKYNIKYSETFPNKKKKFQYIINEWGADLQSEHERFLVEKHFKCPVILFDYPAKIKAFYMRLNDNTEPGKETVRAMDILFPGIGEIVGGSQREERLDVLKAKMAELDIPEEDLWWYLDLRKYGTAVHSGFGLGFERLVMFATGMGNIRDVIPYPRTPFNAEF